MTVALKSLVATGVVAFVVFLLATAPAAVVAGRVAALDPALSLAGISGTAWRGRAHQVRYGPVVLGALEWRLSVLQLLTGRTAMRVELVGPDARVSANLRRTLVTGRTRVSGVDGMVPLTLVARITGATGPLDAVIDLAGVSFTTRGDTVEHAHGTVTLRETTALIPRRYPLGDYVLDLAASDGWLEATVTEADGPLTLAGMVRMRGDGRWAVDARARAAAADSELAMVLGMLGEADDDGYRQLELSGSL